MKLTVQQQRDAASDFRKLAAQAKNTDEKQQKLGKRAGLSPFALKDVNSGLANRIRLHNR